MGAYATIAGRVADFLSGDEGWITDALQREMAELSAALDYEKAAELKELLSFCERFCRRQRFIHQFTTETLVISELGGHNVEYRFRRGDLVEAVPAEGSPAACLAVPGELLQPLTDRRWVLDRANVTYSWLNQNQEGSTFAFS